jgi:hypothetical protein
VSSEFSALKDKANAAVSDATMGITSAIGMIKSDIADGLGKLKDAADGIIPDVAIKLPNLGTELGKLQSARAAGSIAGAASLLAGGSPLAAFAALAASGSLPGINIGSLTGGAAGLDLCSEAPNVDLIDTGEIDEAGQPIYEAVKKGLTSDASTTDSDPPEKKEPMKAPGEVMPKQQSKSVPEEPTPAVNSPPAPIQKPPSPPLDAETVESPFFKFHVSWHVETAPDVGGGKIKYWTVKSKGNLKELYRHYLSKHRWMLSKYKGACNSDRVPKEPYKATWGSAGDGTFKYYHGTKIWCVLYGQLAKMSGIIHTPDPRQSTVSTRWGGWDGSAAGAAIGLVSSDLPKPSRNTTWSPVFDKNKRFVGLDHSDTESPPEYSNAGERKKASERGNTLDAIFNYVYKDAKPAPSGTLKEFIEAHVEAGDSTVGDRGIIRLTKV